MPTTTLHDLFMSKHQRVERQNELVFHHKLPLVTLTLHMPVELAKKSYTKVIFQSAINAIQGQLAELGWAIATRQLMHLNIGSEALFVVDTTSANQLKKAMIKIERHHPLGAIFNIDVSDARGKTISRKSSQLPPRQCIICDEIAQRCNMNNKHSISEIETKILALCDRQVNVS
ncbi:citrate lyase holo-[acyl-carrier protein] synthase [Vibrio tapetis]|uniref:citrate lyase holo-[acyl-carrier protein] synthase n=1 Tax=Vibrio tapetis subsp. tapetis TaxID=1671868 RepID=A0A2N8ZIQ9_9VIBR|nr:citrate lyase holo-[acyl-carrier protein] synthase [Vibrio tapetis]SON51792.1 conserved protein of unknown function [Vibrio tapetis subsp. tapetis]